MCNPNPRNGTNGRRQRVRVRTSLLISEWVKHLQATPRSQVNKVPGKYNCPGYWSYGLSALSFSFHLFPLFLIFRFCGFHDFFFYILAFCLFFANPCRCALRRHLCLVYFISLEGAGAKVGIKKSARLLGTGTPRRLGSGPGRNRNRLPLDQTLRHAGTMGNICFPKCSRKKPLSFWHPSRIEKRTLVASAKDSDQ